MTEYHEDAVCGSCGGPLEIHRDAVCETCVPESAYFEVVAACQEAVEAMEGGENGDLYSSELFV